MRTVFAVMTFTGFPVKSELPSVSIRTCSILNSLQLKMPVQPIFMSDSALMAVPPGRDSDLAPAQACPICGFTMRQFALLPESFRYPMQRFYRCTECNKVEMVDVH
jgi:hypothetical protein